MGISEGISCSMVLGIRKSPYLWITMIKRLSILLWSFALRTVHQMCGMMWQFLNTSTNSLTFLSPKNAVYELSPWKWAGSFFCFNHWNTEEMTLLRLPRWGHKRKCASTVLTEILAFENISGQVNTLSALTLNGVWERSNSPTWRGPMATYRSWERERAAGLSPAMPASLAALPCTACVSHCSSGAAPAINTRETVRARTAQKSSSQTSGSEGDISHSNSNQSR